MTHPYTYFSVPVPHRRFRPSFGPVPWKLPSCPWAYDSLCPQFEVFRTNMLFVSCVCLAYLANAELCIGAEERPPGRRGMRERSFSTSAYSAACLKSVRAYASCENTTKPDAGTNNMEETRLLSAYLGTLPCLSSRRAKSLVGTQVFRSLKVPWGGA